MKVQNKSGRKQISSSQSSSNNTHDRTEQFKYVANGIEAAGHTPIYKMHKYFARRPQNVFRYLLEHYSTEDDVVLDCFCGGGVTLFEGLSLGRRVIAVDTNPLAAFVSQGQVTCVPVENFMAVANEIRDAVDKFSAPLYQTRDRDNGNIVPTRWFEFAYTVSCPSCGKETALSNQNKAEKDGKLINGRYQCEVCGKAFQALEGIRKGQRLLSVTYKITTRATQKTVAPDDIDFETISHIENNFDTLIHDHDIWLPTDEIPEHWDRQKEDCLHRKGVKRFSDFFTKRTLLVMGYFLKVIRSYRGQVDPEMYRMLLYLFSATLRYTNNLTISTAGWMDGRPVAWAKHAYWLSNQFVEVNPIEYIDKRISAFKSALNFQATRLKSAKAVSSFDELHRTDGGYFLLNQSSECLPIPDASVSLVLTDPPYGSNVQYGELSAFWLVWLRDDLNLKSDQILGLDSEVLVNRKKGPKRKDYQSYYEGLRSIYKECHRVLKPGRPLVFTFNNKDIHAWFAVVKAALDAGFILEPDGLIYQSPIENYRNTAHTRYAGSLHGDFIYTFIKPANNFKLDIPNEYSTDDLESYVQRAVADLIAIGRPFSENEAYACLIKRVVPVLARIATEESQFEQAIKQITGSHFELVLKASFRYDTSQGLWTA